MRWAKGRARRRRRCGEGQRSWKAGENIFNGRFLSFLLQVLSKRFFRFNVPTCMCTLICHCRVILCFCQCPSHPVFPADSLHQPSAVHALNCTSTRTCSAPSLPILIRVSTPRSRTRSFSHSSRTASCSLAPVSLSLHTYEYLPSFHAIFLCMG